MFLCYLQKTVQISAAHSIAYLRGWRARGKQAFSAKTRTVLHKEISVTLLQTVKPCNSRNWKLLKIQKVQKEIKLDFYVPGA